MTETWVWLGHHCSVNETGQLRESDNRCIGLAGEIGTLVAVTHHAGSWTNGTFYIHNNHRGDIILTRSGTTINTVTVGRYDYSAFGNLRSQLGPDVSRFKFSSKERDASTGLSYYGYRFYSPQWQRWINRDPLGDSESPTVTVGSALLSSSGNTTDLNRNEASTIWLAVNRNLYSHVGNNPVTRNDGYGLSDISQPLACPRRCLEFQPHWKSLGFSSFSACVGQSVSWANGWGVIPGWLGLIKKYFGLGVAYLTGTVAGAVLDCGMMDCIKYE